MPTGTIESIDVGKMTLKLEIDGVETLVNFTTTTKVDEWVVKRPNDYHKGSVIEYAASKGVIGKVTPAGGFKKATEKVVKVEPKMDVTISGSTTTKTEPKSVAATTKTEPKESQPKTQQELWEEVQKQKARTDAFESGQKAMETVQKNKLPQPAVTGMYDPKGVSQVVAKITINLSNFENISLEVTAVDWETARLCLIEGTTIFGQNHEVTRELVQNYAKRVLLRSLP